MKKIRYSIFLNNTIYETIYKYYPLEISVIKHEDEENIYDIEIINKNKYEVKFKIIDEKDEYVVNYIDNDEEWITIKGKESKKITVQVVEKQEIIYTDTQKDEKGSYNLVKLMIQTDTPPYTAEKQEIEEVKIYLKENVKNKIVEDAGTIDDIKEGQVFTGPSAKNEGGLYSIIDPVSKETIYFYRGNVNNNYVSFAGLTWRILRINEDGSLRIILDSTTGTNTKYKKTNEPTNKTTEGAIEHLNWKNSTAYSTLKDWYNTNIVKKGYEEYVVKQNYVFETAYHELGSSSNDNKKVAYFDSYVRIGGDGNTFAPTFSYNNNTSVKDVVGLITGDEIVYAGGYWNQENTNYFLYNSAIKKDSWTMSPSFYEIEPSTHKAGMLILGSNGKIHDWPTSGNTLTESLALRPVISIRGDLKMHGTGVKVDEYAYTE